MRIGLTYDLRDDYLAAGFSEEETAEFDRPDTIDAIDESLLTLGYETVRIGHARELIQRIATGESWDLVFNICEGLYGLGREAQVPAILDIYQIPYTFSDPCALSVCLDKSVAKAVVGQAGVPTPRSVVIEDLDQLKQISRLNFPLFAKPVAEGTGKGVTPASCVSSRSELEAICEQLLFQFHQPVLIEEFLPGREFTVGILGTGKDAVCLGTLEIVLREDAEANAYSYVNKERCEELVEYRLVNSGHDHQVAEAERLALAAWLSLKCRDAGRIDMRCDAAGQPQFLETNPIAGLHPFHSDLPMLATAVGVSYQELIRRIVESASLRSLGRDSPAEFMSGSRTKVEGA